MTAPRIDAAEVERISREDVPSVGPEGVRVLALGEGSCSVWLPYDPRSIRPGGTISGPTMMGLADFALYVAVMTAIGPVKLAVTTDLTCHFLRRPEPRPLVAHAKLLKLGRRLAIGEVAVHAEGETEPVAHIVATYSIPPEAGAAS
ncbi:MAG: PaaI family thioesterase [Alphaproteobacteria bacterium]|nr:PaaI family thioesterase [Alphaproteobacteria bacterium]